MILDGGEMSIVNFPLFGFFTVVDVVIKLIIHENKQNVDWSRYFHFFPDDDMF